jgi:hypothetical protein
LLPGFAALSAAAAAARSKADELRNTAKDISTRSAAPTHSSKHSNFLQQRMSSSSSDEHEQQPPLTPSGKSRVVVKVRVRRVSSVRTPRGDDKIAVLQSVADEPPLSRSRVEKIDSVATVDGAGGASAAARRESLSESLSESETASASESASLQSDVDDVDRSEAQRFVAGLMERALAVEFANTVMRRALSTLSAVH